MAKTSDKDTVISVRQRKKSSMVDMQNHSDKSRHVSWYRGEHTNILPQRHQLYSADEVKTAVLHGLKPAAPVIDKSTRITAFGSCFAANISNHLAARNFNIAGQKEAESKAYVIRCGEGMVNTFVLRQQFEWAWENRQFDQDLWHGYDKEAYGYDESVRIATRDIFDQTDVFILTVGLSEIWYDEPTGNVFWRTIPKDSYDPERHKFRVSTVGENKENLEAIRQLIRKHRPDAKFIVTLSPVPLYATFRDQSCMASNAVSKATLRVALDEFIREAGDDDLYYWPSYEMVQDVFAGAMKADMRHPKDDVLQFIMYLFENVWCIPEDGDEVDLNEYLAIALAECGFVLPQVARLIKRKNYTRLRSLTEERTLSKDDKIHQAMVKLIHQICDAADAKAA
ncbi:GSCFA domain-containing protein [Pseudooctadecabacter jejudonensis]|uniref:GSCFA domain-containing protein n=1 Tax=Pseudooctadecabacter jejudonensis TaxID=1391910 RepID=UPI0013566039|nr:GSCFA domain-containing protein [Pseudooctadecabacter jejudonensis]